ncbi:MAG: hypothetical protein KA190_23780 [Kofleriaceae bacterium]|jgi:hypothetical protein|nr:hypothetical protein [Kofleriaceae bacterium]
MSVLSKPMLKVLSPIEKKGGGTYWMRVGTAFYNQDQSINIHLDALPTNQKLQLREMDEEDLRRRDGTPHGARGGLGSTSPAAPGPAAGAAELPF